MFVARIPNRTSPPAYLLREGYRENGKVKNRTLANLSHWPMAKLERLRRVLRDEAPSEATGRLTMLRSLPHGHVAAVLGMGRKIGLERLLAGPRAPARQAALVLAMIVARILDPASKLATARQLDETTATFSLGALLGLGSVTEQELYAALDWLLGQQPRLEQRLAARHLSQGTLVLYDVSSTYFEGRSCPLARYGYSRDGKRDRRQIVFGLLCAGNGSLRCHSTCYAGGTLGSFARWRWKSSRAMWPIRPRWPARSRSSGNASASAAWCSSATAA